MELFTILLVLFVLLLISYMFEKNLYNPLSVFLIIWIIIISLSNLRLYDMLPFSYRPCWIVLLGCFGYFVGYFFWKYSFSVKKANNINQNVKKYIFNDKAIKIINIILLLFYAITAIRVFISMRKYGIDYSAMRTLYVNGTKEQQVELIFGSSLLQGLELLFFKPMLFAMLSISIAKVFTNMKIDKQSLITVITLLLNVAVNFGRIVLVQIAFCTIITYFTMGNKFSLEERKKIKRIVKKYVFPSFIIFLAIFMFLSSARQSNRTNSLSFSEELYSYLAIPIPIMDHWLDYVDQNQVQTYGALYIKGGLSIIDTFTNKVGLHLPGYLRSTEVVNSTQTFLHIFPNHNYNAFTSLFYYFYVDWRHIGVFLGSALYGILMAASYHKTKKEKGNLMSCVMYIMLLQGLLKCFVRWEFVQMSYFLSFMFLFFLIIKRKDNKYEKE